VKQINDKPSGTVSNTRTIAGNSFWYALEMVVSLSAGLLTSIIVANVIGKVRLSPYVYVMWLTNITAGVGGNGLSVTTRKYMAEYLNRGEVGVTRAVYSYALRFQTLIAIGVTAVALPLALLAGRPGYRIASALLVMNMMPRMIAYIPSQANVAGERLQRNTGPSLLGGAITIGLTLVSLWMGWGLEGIALSFTLGCAVEAFGKLYSVRSWLAPLPMGTIPPELKKRMSSYSGQGAVLMVINIVVWDRSDMIILNWMNSDISQIALFGIAFGFTDRLLMLPNAFAGSLGATMMAQMGRGPERVRGIMFEGAKYGFLLALPLLVGMACISRQFVTLAYKPEYQPMIPVLALAALLAIPKALIASPTLLLQAVEEQGYLIWIGCICGAVDIGLDFLLTPRYGALGATVANGSAQAMAAVLLWLWVYRYCKMEMRLGELTRIALAGACMAATILLVQYLVPVTGYLGLGLSIVTGAFAWLGALRFTGAVTHADGERLRQIWGHLPAGLRPFLDLCVNLLACDNP
jgi:O-antigen/teichoic acid export membrane protein